jgi:hypothetical protein
MDKVLMDMPATVKVGPHVYRVLRKPKTAMPKHLGSCDCSSLQIWVRQRLKKSKAAEILLHETLHAILHSVCNGESKNEEEDFVEAASPVLLQVLQDNPQLVEYLIR